MLLVPGESRVQFEYLTFRHSKHRAIRLYVTKQRGCLPVAQEGSEAPDEISFRKRPQDRNVRSMYSPQSNEPAIASGTGNKICASPEGRKWYR